jgi:glycosyltransferase involved in cell wall biosynthesis
MNCPVIQEEVDRDRSPMRTKLDLHGRDVIMHHGVIVAGRGIRPTIAAMAYLPPNVAFVVLGDGELVDELAKLASTHQFRNRLYIHPAVPLEEIAAWVSGADVGVVAIEPIGRSYELSTPNKLFECMASGVPVVVSHYPEMRKIVSEAEVGVVCDPSDPLSIADGIMKLLGEESQARMARRRLCRQAATSRYNWGMESEKLTALYATLRTPADWAA